MATERIEHGLVEDLRYQAHVLEHDDPGAVADREAGRLLAAMLQRVQAEVGKLGHVLARRPDTENPAGIPRRPVVGVEIIRQTAIGLDHPDSLWQHYAWATSAPTRSRPPRRAAGRAKAGAGTTPPHERQPRCRGPPPAVQTTTAGPHHPVQTNNSGAL